MLLKIFSFIVKLILKKKHSDFLIRLENPVVSQKNVLKEVTKNSSFTQYGKKCHAAETDDYETFLKMFPMMSYEDYSPFIKKEKSGQRHTFLHQDIIFYEKTSGSSEAFKLIPYGKDLKNSFNNMFKIWLVDLLLNGPKFKTGKLYFSISFSSSMNSSKSIELFDTLENDLDYLSLINKFILRPFWVDSKKLKKLKNSKDFIHLLSLTLLSLEDLEIISIWSPSFLIILLDYIKSNRESILKDLLKKNVLCNELTFSFRKLSGERFLALSEDKIQWNKIWPHLKLISCWADSTSGFGASQLEALFPDSRIQGKGLLSTECPMTFPLIDAKGCVPLIDEVFYEFEESKTLKIFTLSQIKPDVSYALIITQKGGLIRYRMEDLVVVTHFYKSTPCLKFVGRNHDFIDLVGEKMNAHFFQKMIDKKNISNVMLIPFKDNQNRYSYILLSDPEFSKSYEIDFIEKLEECLFENPHYAHARRLGQLLELKGIQVENLSKAYTQFFNQRGLKWGDIKLSLFIKNLETASDFIQYLEKEKHIVLRSVV